MQISVFIAKQEEPWCPEPCSGYMGGGKERVPGQTRDGLGRWGGPSLTAVLAGEICYPNASRKEVEGEEEQSCREQAAEDSPAEDAAQPRAASQHQRVL